MSIDVLPNGVIVAESKDVPELFFRGISPLNIRVRHLDEDILQFNSLSHDKIIQFDSAEKIEIDTSWEIPKEYLNLDLDAFVSSLIQQLSPKDYERGETRLLNELNEFKTRNLENLLRTIIYIVDTFKKNNIVWGVGRGSSCASYLLFKIGLHSVDCLKYNIPLTEFFH